MALRLKPNPTFKFPVEIEDHDGNAMSFVAVFKHLPRDEFRALQERAKHQGELETVAEILVGWEEADGPFSKEALAGLLQAYSYAGVRISDAYWKAIVQGRRGN